MHVNIPSETETPLEAGSTPPQLHSGRALTTEVKTDDVIKANTSVKEKKRPRVRELLHGVVLKSSLPAFMRISCKSMGNVLKEYF